MVGSQEGEMRATIIDTHLVQLSIPECGFGHKLDTVIQFFLEHGEELRVGWVLGNSDREARLLFCFRDPGNAAKFADQFYGVILDEASYDEDSFFPWLYRPSSK